MTGRCVKGRVKLCGELIRADGTDVADPILMDRTVVPLAVAMDICGR